MRIRSVYKPLTCVRGLVSRRRSCSCFPKNRYATGRAIFNHSGGFVGELQPTFVLEFVIAALVDSAFEELLLLAGGDFFS